MSKGAQPNFFNVASILSRQHKNNSIVDTISAMEFYFLALKPLILMVLGPFFFCKHKIRHSLPPQDRNGGCAIVQGV